MGCQKWINTIRRCSIKILYLWKFSTILLLSHERTTSHQVTYFSSFKYEFVLKKSILMQSVQSHIVICIYIYLKRFYPCSGSPKRWNICFSSDYQSALVFIIQYVGIKKNFHLHILIKAGILYLIAKLWSEQMINKFRIIKTYLQYVILGEDTVNSFLKWHGSVPSSWLQLVITQLSAQENKIKIRRKLNANECENEGNFLKYTKT